MVSILEKLNDIGPFTIVLVIALVVILIPLLVESWEKLLSALGLETKKSIKQKEKDEQLLEIKDKLNVYHEEITDYQKEITDKQNFYHEQSIKIREGLAQEQCLLSDAIKELKTMLVNKNIDDMRWEILNFANSVMGGKEYNKEQYDHVLEIYKNYEHVLAENDMENGRVNISMDFITRHYASLMEKGFKQ